MSERDAAADLAICEANKWGESDWTFIDFSREALPYWIAEAQRLQAENARLRAAIEPFNLAFNAVGETIPLDDATSFDFANYLCAGDFRRAAEAVKEGDK